MTIQLPYTYAILHYVHDVMTGAFVNVGVVMHLPHEGRPRGNEPSRRSDTIPRHKSGKARIATGTPRAR
jgi:DUF3037 family protein